MKNLARSQIDLGRTYPYELLAGDNKTAPDWAHETARGVLMDLLDRRGIRQALCEVDPDTRKEIVASIAAIIREGAKDMSRPLITKTENVCGGSACVTNTRIPVWLVEGLRRQGLRQTNILEAYPSLSFNDLEACWDYVRQNQEEIEKEIQENDVDE